MCTHHQDQQAGQLPQGKGEMGIERIPGQAERLPTDRYPCSHKTRISDELPASKGWDLFHIDLKTAFLQGQSDDVNRDVVCQ